MRMYHELRNTEYDQPYLDRLKAIEDTVENIRRSSPEPEYFNSLRFGSESQTEKLSDLARKIEALTILIVGRDQKDLKNIIRGPSKPARRRK